MTSFNAYQKISVFLALGLSSQAFAMQKDVASQPEVNEASLIAPSLVSANKKVCATGPVLKGMDVSNYDSGTNWATVHKSLGFGFIKATEGNTITNNLFASDWKSAKTNGVPRGAYHFFHPSDDPTTQANKFLKVMGTLAATDLPPVLDWEVTDNVSNALQISRAQTFLNVVEKATGRIPVIYVAPAFWNALGNPSAFARYPLFIANYGVSCPEVPAPWKTWTLWQSNTGTVPGVQGEGDQDQYNGNAGSLSAFAAIRSPLK